MNSNLYATLRFLCIVLLILFQQYKIYAETIAKTPTLPKSTFEYIDDEYGQLEGLFFETLEQNIDLEYSNKMPRSPLILCDIHQEISIPIIKIEISIPVNNLSFESGNSILINAP